MVTQRKKVYNIIVIGGAGYVGAYIVPLLQKAGHYVKVVDMLWFGRNELPKSVKFEKRDALSLDKWDFHGFDVAIFMAGLSNDPMAELSPSLNFISNAAAASYTAYISKQAGVKKFILASSCSVYGYSPDRKSKEDDIPSAMFPYGLSKIQAEVGCMALQDDKFDVVCLRKGTISGWSPKMRYDLLINTMYVSALKKGIITIRNTALKRPVLAIKDVAQAYLKAIDLPVKGIFNIASFNSSLGEIADRVAKITDSSVVCDYTTDMRHYTVSLDKAYEQMKFDPKGTVESIITSLIEKAPIPKDEPYSRNATPIKGYTFSL